MSAYDIGGIELSEMSMRQDGGAHGVCIAH